MKYIQPYDQPSNPVAPYVDLNAAMGVDGSIPPAKFFNNVQAEILSVITHAGLTPSDADLTQLWQAIMALIPSSSGPPDAALLHYGEDSGAVNALVVTPSPAAAAVNKGFAIGVLPANTCTGPSAITLNLAGGVQVTKNIVAMDGSPLLPGDITLNSIALMQYDGTAIRLLNPYRQPLVFSSNAVFYVNSTTGSDSNTGTSAGGVGKINCIGKMGVPPNCILRGANKSAIYGTAAGGQYSFSGFSLQVTGTPVGPNDIGAGVFAANGTQISLSNIDFGACQGAHLYAQQAVISLAAAPFTISGGAVPVSGSMGNSPGCFAYSVDGGFITSGSVYPSLTVLNPVSIPIFVYAAACGITGLLFTGITNPSNVTGQKYYADANGVINTNGGGPNYYPGTIAGSLGSNGGRYV